MTAPDWRQVWGVAETGICRVTVIGVGALGRCCGAIRPCGGAVDLLDIPSSPRNTAAKGGIARQLKAWGVMSPDSADLIRPGNIGDDLARVAEADCIMKVAFEDPTAKRDLYRKFEWHRRPGTLVTSNTATLRLADLTAQMRPAFTQDFAISHFVNPPRAMPLVELLAGPIPRQKPQRGSGRGWRRCLARR